MFLATRGPSSGDKTVFVRSLVLVILCGRLSAMQGIQLTLIERKVSGYIHIRKGPNKVRFLVLFRNLEMLLSYFLGSSIFL